MIGTNIFQKVRNNKFERKHQKGLLIELVYDELFTSSCRPYPTFLDKIGLWVNQVDFNTKMLKKKKRIIEMMI